MPETHQWLIILLHFGLLHALEVIKSTVASWWKFSIIKHPWTSSNFQALGLHVHIGNWPRSKYFTMEIIDTSGFPETRWLNIFQRDVMLHICVFHVYKLAFLEDRACIPLLELIQVSCSVWSLDTLINSSSFTLASGYWCCLKKLIYNLSLLS